MVQEHVDAPLLGSQRLLWVDLATGEIEAQCVRSLVHEGSYSSKLQIRSDGRRVEVSGNPSRWMRPHSLDGYVDMDAVMLLYNSILRSVGLPEYYAVERSHLLSGLLQDSVETSVAREGVRLTRVDLSTLYSTADAVDCGNEAQRRGRESSAIVIRALGQVTHAGRVPMVYGHGETVMWGAGSRHVSCKYYAKGVEMLRHGGDEAADAAQWACAAGIVRHELTLRSMWLSRHGLDRPSHWTMEAARDVMTRYAMHTRLGVARGSYQHIYEQLLERGVPEGRARRAQEAAYAYLGGHIFRRGENIPVRTYYRLRADLRSVGLDISAPLNVSTLRYAVRVVEMTPVSCPERFRRAG